MNRERARQAHCVRSAAQSGASLLVVLVMLVTITLFVISMVRLSGTNLKVVSNMQTQRAMELSTQQAIENRISSITFFNDAIAGTGTWAGGATTVSQTVNGYSVSITKPSCIGSQVAEGYSATSSLSPEDTFWDIPANSTDSMTGSVISMSQGVKLRLAAGNCL